MSLQPLALSSRFSALVACLCDLRPAIDHLLDASRDLRNVRGIETTAREPVSEQKIITYLEKRMLTRSIFSPSIADRHDASPSNTSLAPP